MTMASSTTMPMARIRAKRVMRFTVKPSSAIAAKAPMIVTGKVVGGTQPGQKFSENKHNHQQPQYPRLDKRFVHGVHRLINEERRIIEGRVLESRGKSLAHLRHQSANLLCNLKRIGAGKGKDRY